MNLNFKKSALLESPLLLVSPFFLWGTAMVAMKSTLSNTTPFFLAGVRLLPAGLLVLAVAAIFGREQPKSWKAWLWIGIFALLDGAMFQGFLAEGLMRTGAGLGSTIIDSQPLAVALLSSWLFGEVIGLWGWLGLIVGIVGISLIGFPDEWFLKGFPLESFVSSFSWQSLFNSGEWLMLLASGSMALGTVVIRYVCRYADPVVATGWHMVLGGIPMFILSGMYESQQWSQISFDGWLGLLYATVFGSAIAYGVFFFLASRGNLTSLSALTFLTPVFALSFGKLFLAEVLSPLQWGGVGLTIVSIYLINQREKITSQLRSLKLPTFSNSEKAEY
jgi:drug/metabolite transporter (DMT)-like permease